MSNVLKCSIDNNPLGTNSKGFVYPLKIGNKWEYSKELYFFNFRSDTIKLSYRDTLFSTEESEIIKIDSLHDFKKAYVLRERLIEDEYGPYESYKYYNNQTDGLYRYAYQGISGDVAPKSVAKSQIFFNSSYFRNIKEVIKHIENAIQFQVSDSIYYEDPPLKCFHYPLRIGSQRSYRKPNKPWAIDKKVITKEKINVTAGNFYCYKIQWLEDINEDESWDDDIIFYDYICSQGLIKREITLKDVIITNEESKQFGLSDSKTEA